MNLHKQYYEFRDRVWAELENTVHNGCEFVGLFPIDLDQQHHSYHVQIDDINLQVYGTSIIIYGIVKDENYSLFPNKESDEDINIGANKITVIVDDVVGANHNFKNIVVEPDLLNLQELSTYLSGGFSA